MRLWRHCLLPCSGLRSALWQFRSPGWGSCAGEEKSQTLVQRVLIRREKPKNSVIMLTGMERAWQSYVKDWLVWCRFLCREDWLAFYFFFLWQISWNERRSRRGYEETECKWFGLWRDTTRKLIFPVERIASISPSVFFSCLALFRTFWPPSEIFRSLAESMQSQTLFFLDAFLQILKSNSGTS